MTRTFLDKIYAPDFGTSASDLYQLWAPSYDDELRSSKYVTPTRCAKMLFKYCSNTNIEILDFGCGSGGNTKYFHEKSFLVQCHPHIETSTTSYNEVEVSIDSKLAMQAMEAGDDQAFHQAALHSLQIVLSLRFVLDTDSGSELSESLFATYTTIAASLKKANQEKDIESVATIYEALDELRNAWHSVTVSYTHLTLPTKA
mgnify:CR=1 FL=1